MIIVNSVSQLRDQVAQWRREGERVALVPTMGNLHAGHIELIKQADELADRVVVSVFVNPMQFGEGEDFDGYPRTMEADAEKLEAVNTDLLFAPSVDEVYPKSDVEQTRVEVPGISNILCGASRPGHFIGVATVVCKLFNMVQPDIAVFGEKDYQQLMVIRRMTADLSMPVMIYGLATVREEDGLAMSSRNGYLSKEERGRAPALCRTLQLIAIALQTGDKDFSGLESQANAELEKAGFSPDYFHIRRANDLADPTAEDNELVLLAAAHLGKARLIDNLPVNLEG
ncbi:pantoate--beta-alanine ligase [Solemya velesiana gill symbiont]|uniref:Pantothenate synthetase n=1 Tax=Solemya velesiana gill symbiont TaxID=1918948 RepID=A0A1T2KNE8_9GAMM|nr:pantoate--beta-alanine ligase [Solemya velesiana gill symbiont]OOZ34403.1 pantoate--beta-alanine ligase [Solemya velesiana gill symbiont]